MAGYAAMWAARKQQLVVLEAGRLRDAFGAFTFFSKVTFSHLARDAFLDLKTAAFRFLLA